MAISTEIRCQSTRKSPLLHTGPHFYLFIPSWQRKQLQRCEPSSRFFKHPLCLTQVFVKLASWRCWRFAQNDRTPRHPWSQDLSIRNRSFGKRPWSLWGLQTAIDQWISHLNCWSLGLNHPKAKCKGSHETFKLNNELSYLPVPTGYSLDWS